jgi:hypothetical protein
VLTSNDLSGWNFAGQNLTNSVFGRADSGSNSAILVGTDFSDANLTGANFGGAKLSDANFRNANLANANFQYFAGYSGSRSPFGCGRGFPWCTPVYVSATLTNAELTAADARGTSGLALSETTHAHLIHPDGHIRGLNLEDGGLLIVRDYDGDSRNESTRPPIPITVDEHLAMTPGGTLRMVFEADAWDSTISFAPGIPVTLGGTLELIFAADVNLATQVGRTFDLFDWTGVTPTGTFAVSSPYIWNVSNLYTTGEVTLTAIPEPTSLAFAVLILPFAWRVRRLRKRADSLSAGSATVFRDDPNDRPQGLVHRIGIGKVLAHVGREHHGPFFKFEMLNYRRFVRLANLNRMAAPVLAGVFSARAAGEIVFPLERASVPCFSPLAHRFSVPTSLLCG